jgi:hypothetical protein
MAPHFSASFVYLSYFLVDLFLDVSKFKTNCFSSENGFLIHQSISFSGFFNLCLISQNLSITVLTSGSEEYFFKYSCLPSVNWDSFKNYLNDFIFITSLSIYNYLSHYLFIYISRLITYNKITNNPFHSLYRNYSYNTFHFMIFNNFIIVKCFITTYRKLFNTITLNSIIKYRCYLINKSLSIIFSITFI